MHSNTQIVCPRSDGRQAPFVFVGLFFYAGTVITEEDYRIYSSVGKLGADIMSASGRISSGPRCKDMSVTATATNDNGLKATISDNVSKTNSFGSTIFEDNAKVSGRSTL